MDVYCKQIEYSGNDVITFSTYIIHLQPYYNLLGL